MKSLLLCALLGAMGAAHPAWAAPAPKTAAPKAAASTAATTAKPVEAPMLDLNKASEEQLLTLPGIGPAKARAIVEYRTRTPFSKVEDLLRVKGVGRGIFRAVRDHVTVGPAPRAAR